MKLLYNVIEFELLKITFSLILFHKMSKFLSLDDTHTLLNFM